MANYIRENFSPDLDFGTGEWSASAWFKQTHIRSNLTTYSNTLTQWPASRILQVVPADVSPPAGSTTAYKVEANTDWGIHSITFPNSIGTSFIKTVAIKAKAGTSNYININQWSGAYPLNVTFYLDTGTVSGVGAKMTSLGDGWYLCVATYQWIDNGSPPNISFSDNSGGKYVYLCDAQINYGYEISPYIETTTTAYTGGNGIVLQRAFTSGPFISLEVTNEFKLTVAAYDGTTTRTVTTTAAYNTASWIKAEACYTTDGTLSIRVNGQQVAATYGAPLGSLNNSNAVLTIGNSYNLDAPFPGSLALLKLSATVPTAEQSQWMYEQEKQMFREGAQVTLPDSNAINDLTYDEVTDKWIAVSSTNMSEWSGLVRTNVTAVPSGSYSKLAAAGGVTLQARGSNVDITIPSYGLRKELVKRAEATAKQARTLVPFDYVGGFTASTTNGATSITSVASLTYPTSYIGAQITGTGIQAGTVITAVNGTTIYISKPATATGTAVQISFTDFILPVGYEAKAVMSSGALKQEGWTKDYTRLFDGFKETLRFGAAPGYTAWVQVQAVRSAA